MQERGRRNTLNVHRWDIAIIHDRDADTRPVHLLAHLSEALGTQLFE
jgi:hypothetical protein